MDTPEMRRVQLQQQREDSQQRLEQRRDAVIAAKVSEDVGRVLCIVFCVFDSSFCRNNNLKLKQQKLKRHQL
jgi:hypothetical protein